MAANAWAELRLPSLFTEHMVLQRGQSIPVWGWADAGAKVRVKLGGKSSNTSAAPDGTWRADLPSMKAGGPHMLTISSGDKTVKIGDVLIGEVWTGSGQSNMQWTVGLSRDSQTEIASANYGTMRLFYVPRKTADTPQTDVDAKWEVCTSETVPEFSAVLYYFGRTLLRELDVPIGLIHSSWGGTPAESWASRERLGSTPETRPILEWWDRHLKELPQLQADYQAKITAWEEQAKAAKERGEPEPRRPGGEPFGADHPWRASSLYNAMIHPLVPYGIQGAIWYQGESNAGRAHQYRTLFAAMIEDWRAAWGGRDFPFVLVQLANFTKRLDQPADSDWAELREAQTMATQLPDVGMAVTIDIGEAEDIHPKNKQDVGTRLAAWALANTYKRDVSSSGPMYFEKSVEQGKIRIKFAHAENGLVKVGEKLTGFAIAGADKKFVWADAAIDGDSVVVSSPEVPSPESVRYGWANNPACNLYNRSGLPASPFRTDDWPGITEGKLTP